jgi:hypothetical protein
MSSGPPSSGQGQASIELNAIYHYCRSILVDTPFQTGVENLKLMFEKSSKRSAASNRVLQASSHPMGRGSVHPDSGHYVSGYDEYDRRMPSSTSHTGVHQGLYFPPGGGGGGPGAGYPHGKKSKQNPELAHSNLCDFLSLFLSLMNEIFTLSLSELSVSAMALNCHMETDFNHQLLADHQTLAARVSGSVSSLLPKLLDDFELLFSNLTSQLSSEILLRLLTICLFAIHFTRHELRRRAKLWAASAPSPPPSLINSDIFFAEFKDNRFITESFGITCLFSLVSR